LDGPGLVGDTSSFFGGVAGPGDDACARFGRKRRPSSLMADIGRGRFNKCSRPVVPVLAGGGGADVVVPVGGDDGIFVCAAACVSCRVNSDELEINEALVSALNAFSAASRSFSAASRSAFCCRRILLTSGE
jgi:hypothetical protein